MEFNDLNLEPEPSYLDDLYADEPAYLDDLFARPAYIKDMDMAAVEWFLTHNREV